ncbi:MAG: porin [Moraxellaceae bacterium]|nr:porin [Moraxellaceae bacterium]
MKRTLIALAVMAAVTAPLAAQAAPKVYGKLNLSVEQYEKNYEDVTKQDESYSRLQSNASRFGLKGEDEISATLSAVYLIEWGVDADTAGVTDLKGRNRYLGIKSQDFGTIKLGAYDTYMKLSQDRADLFNDLLGDMEYVIAGENRVNNVVGYESPKILDALQVNVMLQAQDNSNTIPAPHQNGMSSSVAYSKEDTGVYVALAMDNNMTGKTALSGVRESDTVRLVATYKIGDLFLSGVYGVSKASTGPGNEETGLTAAAAYKIGDETLKVSYGVAKADESAAAVQKRTLLNVGIDHNLTSKTKAYAFYTLREEDKLAANGDSDDAGIAVGLEHSF